MGSSGRWVLRRRESRWPGAGGRGRRGGQEGREEDDAEPVMTVLRYRGPLCKIPFAIFLNVSTLYVYTYRPCLREVLPPKSEQDEDNPHLHG